MPLEPIAYDYGLRCSIERAFDTYANRIGEWWHPAYTLNAVTFATAKIEPRVGGRVYAVHEIEGEVDWGRVRAWEPSVRLVHSWTLAQPEDAPSEISILFKPQARGSAMRFEHGGWNEANARARAKFSDWRIILERFVALANAD